MKEVGLDLIGRGKGLLNRLHGKGNSTIMMRKINRVIS